MTGGMGRTLRRLRGRSAGQLARGALARVRDGMARHAGRRRDAGASTYGEAIAGKLEPLPLGALCPAWPGDLASRGEREVESILAHRFDLLGSGPVEVRRGVRCAGLEGHRYEPESPGAARDAEVSDSNRAESQRLWQLLESPPSSLRSASDFRYEPIDWQLDFRSGFRFDPLSWWGDVRVGAPPGADIKLPWELGRMQHLPFLAWAGGLAGGADGRRLCALEFRSQVLDFMASNPPRFGAQWACAMDVAMRVASWVTAWSIFERDGVEFDPDFEAAFARGVDEHARHLIHHLEGTPDYRANHYLANLAGLLFAASVLPRSGERDAWLAFGVQELARQVESQFHSDGSHFESSTAYHRLCAEMVFTATALVLGLPEDRRRAFEEYDASLHRVEPPLLPAPLPEHPLPSGDGRVPFPPLYFERLARMADFLAAIEKPSGDMLQIGDNDSGRFLPMRPPGTELRAGLDLAAARARGAALGLGSGGARAMEAEAALVAGLLCGAHAAGGAATVRPAPRGVSEDPQLAALLSRRFESSDEERRQRIEVPLPRGAREGAKVLAYPDFGLLLIRSPRLFLALRFGGVAPGHPGSHAHNDTLHLELEIDGRALCADPGSYLYTPCPELRDAYRSLRAHFAPRLGDLEPAPLDEGLFRLRVPPGRALYLNSDGLAAERNQGEATIVRHVRLEAESLVIEDLVEGPLPAGSSLARLSISNTAVRFSPGYGVRDDESEGA